MVIDLDIKGLAPGLRMQVHEGGDQMISAALRRDHCWEAYETALTLKLLKPGEVYVDVGANIGYYTLVAAQQVGPAGKVFAYEPDPANFALLASNVELNGLSQVQIFPCALYDKAAEGELFLSGDNFGDHRIYPPAAGSGEARSHRRISLVHGDTHLGERTQRIDFLKIDTQGAEYFVVNGLQQLIRHNRDQLRLVLEFCPYGIRHSGADGHELVRLLDDFGMQLQIIDHQQQCLIPAQAHHLNEWVSRMADEPQNEGFVNLLLLPPGYTVPR